MLHSPVWPDPKALLNDPTLTSPSLRSSTTNSSTGIGCLYTWYPWWPFWVTNRVATSTLLNRNIWSFCNRFIITNINFCHSREDSTFFWMSLMITHIKILQKPCTRFERIDLLCSTVNIFYLITTSIFNIILRNLHCLCCSSSSHYRQAWLNFPELHISTIIFN